MGTQPTRKLAVVTGASSGIGYELARQCLAHDHDVIVCAEDEGLDSAAATLDGGGGGTVRAVRADLSTYDGAEALWEQIQMGGRPVDALLLNAGVGVGGVFAETGLHAELAMIALNCHHTVHLAKRVLPGMIAHGRGRILITGSLLSTAPSPYMAVYGATKAFLLSFGEALRHEVKGEGVTVTVVRPGATETGFYERAHMEDTALGRADKDDPALIATQAFAAMMAGDDEVVAGGIKTKLQGALAEVLPEALKARMVARASKPRGKD